MGTGISHIWLLTLSIFLLFCIQVSADVSHVGGKLQVPAGDSDVGGKLQVPAGDSDVGGKIQVPADDSAGNSDVVAELPKSSLLSSLLKRIKRNLVTEESCVKFFFLFHVCVCKEFCPNLKQATYSESCEKNLCNKTLICNEKQLCSCPHEYLWDYDEDVCIKNKTVQEIRNRLWYHREVPSQWIQVVGWLIAVLFIIPVIYVACIPSEVLFNLDDDEGGENNPSYRTFSAGHYDDRPISVQLTESMDLPPTYNACFNPESSGQFPKVHEESPPSYNTVAVKPNGGPNKSSGSGQVPTAPPQEGNEPPPYEETIGNHEDTP